MARSRRTPDRPARVRIRFDNPTQPNQAEYFDLALAKPGTEVLIERWFDLADRSFNKRMAIGQKRYLERVRGYDLDEISMMFSSCDLSIRAVFGDFDGAGFTHQSPRLILVGMKK